MAGAGNGISMIAFPWLVLQRSGSAVEASVVAMAGTLPLLVSTVIAGAAVDYIGGRRRVSMISDLLSALSVAAVPVVALIFGADAVINVAVLAGLAALGAAFDPASMTAARPCCPRRRPARAGRWTTPTARVRGRVQPGLHRRARYRRHAHRHPRRSRDDVGDRGRLRVLHRRHLGAETRGRRKAGPRCAARPVWAGVVEGLKFVWNLEVLRTPGDHRSDRHGPLHADGSGAVPQILHRPRRAGAAGLGVDGAVDRWSHRGTELCGAGQIRQAPGSPC